MGYPATYPGGGVSGIKGRASLLTALPSWLTVTRGAGSWSRQTATAAHGTTFLATGTTQNTGRLSYCENAGRLMLLIEPTRSNILQASRLVDAGPDDNPDGWTNANGAAGVDYDCSPTGAPIAEASEQVWRALNTANLAGVQGGITLGATTTYAVSILARSAGTISAAKNCMAINTNPGYDYLALPEGTYDYTWLSRQTTTVGGSANGVYMQVTASPGAQLSFFSPQVEAGAYRSSWIPTAAAATATRAAELCAVNAARVSASSGVVSFLWSPLGWGSTTFATVATLFEWAPNWRLDYDGADDKFKVVVNGTNRAESAAQTFSAGALYRLTVRYGSGGQWLTVNGTTTSDTNAWGSPTLAPYLGSRAASANCESAHYGDLLLAA